MEKIKIIFDTWMQHEAFARVASIVIGVTIIIVISGLIKQRLNNHVKATENKYKARKAVNFFAYLFVAAIILFVYSDKLGNIGTFLGFMGAGVAFALQEVIVSFAGWLNIVLTNSVAVGQRIKIGNVKGDVIDIGVLSTTIMETGDWIGGDLYNGCIVTMANSFVFKEKIHNYSGEYPFLWDELLVPIRTESDYKLARKVFTETLNEVCGDYAKQSSASWKKLANKYQVEEAQVMPMVTLVFDEKWITFSLRYIVDYKKRRTTKDIIYTRLLDEIAKHDEIIVIATSTMEVTTMTKE